MLHFKAVAYAAIGASIPTLCRVLFVAVVRDVARRLSITIFGVRLYDRSLGRIHRDPIWHGVWEVGWLVDSDNFEYKNSCDGKLYRCFNVVAIDGVGIASDGQSIAYGFLGKLSRDRTIVTGTWFDRRGSSSGYHGTYQLRLLGLGKIAAGKWIGFSETSKFVKSGELKWEKK